MAHGPCRQRVSSHWPFPLWAEPPRPVQACIKNPVAALRLLFKQGAWAFFHCHCLWTWFLQRDCPTLRSHARPFRQLAFQIREFVQVRLPLWKEPFASLFQVWWNKQPMEKMVTTSPRIHQQSGGRCPTVYPDPSRPTPNLWELHAVYIDRALACRWHAAGGWVIWDCADTFGF